MPDSAFYNSGHPVSITETLLAHQKRLGSSGPYTQLLKMQKRMNALLQLHRTGVPSGLIVDLAETQDFTNPENAIDGMQEIQTGTRTHGAPGTSSIHFDFGSIASRSLYWCTGIGNTSGSVASGRWDLDTSDDKVMWTERDTWGRTTSNNALDFPSDYQGRNVAAVSFRYVRLQFVGESSQGAIAGAVAQLSTTDFFDDPTPTIGAVVNVKAKLQRLIDEGNLWKDLGPASIIGTRYGQDALAQYGMQPTLRNDVTGSDLAAILPNDETHLRAHLEIDPSDASIETGLSVIKV